MVYGKILVQQIHLQEQMVLQLQQFQLYLQTKQVVIFLIVKITVQVQNFHIFNWNFGNGYFGTTAITSAGSNGNGSLFEYDVPSGYYALNTKNINTYG